MKRGEVWTVAGGSDYSGKPRPAVIVQDDLFSDTASATICVMTTTILAASLTRITIEPSSANGLQARSQVMADKISTVPRARLGYRIEVLSAADMN
ncbi:MAG: type II toxin-antitoxin system PemK/MazF family toxin, partial [Alphaproteobacteria bacterium]|nr:type II toxin-antitoxin system PemK/MazF family toxin [Alphaproteobacteria bacterium]